ncbi:hypothetical protein BDW59DRAFT_155481 [Aspergillus cavernicola]|uniref:HNH nuclease domain-containing protein n=1 Tax=Aspergillus cavernicola TaxID=176166 RepID=A0ABR4H8F5_9EURO
MTSPIVRLFNRLDSLWDTLTDPTMDQHLIQNSFISSQFLIQRNITLSAHDFQTSGTTSTNLGQNPPILFCLQSPDIIARHPLNYQGEYFVLAARAGAAEDPTPRHNLNLISAGPSTVWDRGILLAAYIQRWAIRGYPRVLPPGVLNLGEFCNISAVVHPHALDLTTLGWDRNGPQLNIRWQTDVFEYTTTTPNGLTLHPHLILLSVQSCRGEERYITLGELTAIMTAMRNRARQPAVFDEDAALEDEGEPILAGSGNPILTEADLEFRYERRFPVLMVSLVGPHHVRVLYACMDGLRLVIRMSQLYDIDIDVDGLMNFIARVLLSHPLRESGSQ